MLSLHGMDIFHTLPGGIYRILIGSVWHFVLVFISTATENPMSLTGAPQVTDLLPIQVGLQDSMIKKVRWNSLGLTIIFVAYFFSLCPPTW